MLFQIILLVLLGCSEDSAVDQPAALAGAESNFGFFEDGVDEYWRPDNNVLRAEQIQSEDLIGCLFSVYSSVGAFEIGNPCLRTYNSAKTA